MGESPGVCFFFGGGGGEVGGGECRRDFSLSLSLTIGQFLCVSVACQYEVYVFQDQTISIKAWTLLIMNVLKHART